VNQCGNIPIHPWEGGRDTHTFYPNGSNYHDLNPNGRPNNPSPQALIATLRELDLPIRQGPSIIPPTGEVGSTKRAAGRIGSWWPFKKQQHTQSMLASLLPWDRACKAVFSACLEKIAALQVDFSRGLGLGPRHGIITMERMFRRLAWCSKYFPLWFLSFWCFGNDPHK